MRLVVTGGGTGGHIYPALAVAEALQSDPAVESITYIGKTGGLENDLVPQHGIDFLGLEFYGMPRVKSLLLPVQLLNWFAKLEQAKRKAKAYLSDIRPSVVFGTGGYVSAPVLMAAHDLKIPYVVHEPDAKPGLVNQLMSRNAAVITTSFSEGAELLKRKPTQEVLVTGNPIRGSIGTLSRQEGMKLLGLDWPDTQPILLVTGGSQGARRINQAVVEALPTLLNELGLAVVHLTGKKLYDETQAALDAVDASLKTHPFYQIRPYSGEMAALLGVADVALCRAGSLSLSEMYVCGVPTLLVPYPHAAADHQRKNAQASVRSKASILMEDADCNGARLVQALSPLIQDSGMLAAMKSAAIGLGHPDATTRIVACLKRFGNFS
ncbi:undecaprenyldiphospho-muramoylpentapeptide beta-N-acetylglucosaminyltransferase [Vampirovibrio sp.]|uniref:undecaprenyldiphospho-muramoylpentapeptide beta-N-acetylglucosaminyltransferase n=1 Tax=Vampirovibrio sp. TaxID=2717857 RepID=UPI003593A81C